MSNSKSGSTSDSVEFNPSTVEPVYIPKISQTSKLDSKIEDSGVNDLKEDFFPSIIKIKIDGEDYLEIDLLDYFERINRQGWSCVKVKKI